MYRTEIIVDKFEFGAKPNGFSGQNNNQNNFNSEEKQNNLSSDKIEYPTDDIDPEDIPF